MANLCPSASRSLEEGEETLDSNLTTSPPSITTSARMASKDLSSPSLHPGQLLLPPHHPMPNDLARATTTPTSPIGTPPTEEILATPVALKGDLESTPFPVSPLGPRTDALAHVDEHSNLEHVDEHSKETKDESEHEETEAEAEDELDQESSRGDEEENQHPKQHFITIIPHIAQTAQELTLDIGDVVFIRLQFHDEWCLVEKVLPFPSYATSTLSIEETPHEPQHPLTGLVPAANLAPVQLVTSTVTSSSSRPSPPSPQSHPIVQANLELNEQEEDSHSEIENNHDVDYHLDRVSAWNEATHLVQENECVNEPIAEQQQSVKELPASEMKSLPSDILVMHSSPIRTHQDALPEVASVPLIVGSKQVVVVNTNAGSHSHQVAVEHEAPLLPSPDAYLIIPTHHLATNLALPDVPAMSDETINTTLDPEELNPLDSICAIDQKTKSSPYLNDSIARDLKKEEMVHAEIQEDSLKAIAILNPQQNQHDYSDSPVSSNPDMTLAEHNATSPATKSKKRHSRRRRHKLHDDKMINYDFLSRAFPTDSNHEHHGAGVDIHCPAFQNMVETVLKVHREYSTDEALYSSTGTTISENMCAIPPIRPILEDGMSPQWTREQEDVGALEAFAAVGHSSMPPDLKRNLITVAMSHIEWSEVVDTLEGMAAAGSRSPSIFEDRSASPPPLDQEFIVAVDLPALPDQESAITILDEPDKGQEQEPVHQQLLDEVIEVKTELANNTAVMHEDAVDPPEAVLEDRLAPSPLLDQEFIVAVDVPALPDQDSAVTILDEPDKEQEQELIHQQLPEQVVEVKTELANNTADVHEDVADSPEAVLEDRLAPSPPLDQEFIVAVDLPALPDQESAITILDETDKGQEQEPAHHQLLDEVIEVKTELANNTAVMHEDAVDPPEAVLEDRLAPSPLLDQEFIVAVDVPALPDQDSAVTILDEPDKEQEQELIHQQLPEQVVEVKTELANNTADVHEDVADSPEAVLEDRLAPSPPLDQEFIVAVDLPALPDQESAITILDETDKGQEQEPAHHQLLDEVIEVKTELANNTAVMHEDAVDPPEAVLEDRLAPSPLLDQEFIVAVDVPALPDQDSAVTILDEPDKEQEQELIHQQLPEQVVEVKTELANNTADVHEDVADSPEAVLEDRLAPSPPLDQEFIVAVDLPALPDQESAITILDETDKGQEQEPAHHQLLDEVIEVKTELANNTAVMHEDAVDPPEAVLEDRLAPSPLLDQEFIVAVDVPALPDQDSAITILDEPDKGQEQEPAHHQLLDEVIEVKTELANNTADMHEDVADPPEAVLEDRLAPSPLLDQEFIVAVDVPALPDQDSAITILDEPDKGQEQEPAHHQLLDEVIEVKTELANNTADMHEDVADSPEAVLEDRLAPSPLLDQEFIVAVDVPALPDQDSATTILDEPDKGQEQEPAHHQLLDEVIEVKTELANNTADMHEDVADSPEAVLEDRLAPSPLLDQEFIVAVDVPALPDQDSAITILDEPDKGQEQEPAHHQLLDEVIEVKTELANNTADMHEDVADYPEAVLEDRLAPSPPLDQEFIVAVDLPALPDQESAITILDEPDKEQEQEPALHQLSEELQEVELTIDLTNDVVELHEEVVDTQEDMAAAGFRPLGIFGDQSLSPLSLDQEYIVAMGIPADSAVTILDEPEKQQQEPVYFQLPYQVAEIVTTELTSDVVEVHEDEESALAKAEDAISEDIISPPASPCRSVMVESLSVPYDMDMLIDEVATRVDVVHSNVAHKSVTRADAQVDGLSVEGVDALTSDSSNPAPLNYKSTMSLPTNPIVPESSYKPDLVTLLWTWLSEGRMLRKGGKLQCSSEPKARGQEELTWSWCHACITRVIWALFLAHYAWVVVGVVSRLFV